MGQPVLAAIYVLALNCTSFADEGSITPAPSPSGKYEIVTKSHAPKPGGKLILQNKGAPESGVTVIEVDRWAEVKWSDSDNWFAIIDHNDGHSSAIHVYWFSGEINKEKRLKSIIKVYSNPWERIPDCHWDVKKWNVKDGTIQIKATFSDIQKNGKKGQFERIYEVPIDVARPEK